MTPSLRGEGFRAAGGLNDGSHAMNARLTTRRGAASEIDTTTREMR
jgi:hypothetical protein